MRIAFLLGDFPLISETFILDQITWLLDHGCEVDIYAQRLHHDRLAQPDVAAYSLMKRSSPLESPSGLSRRERVGRGLRDLAVACAKNPIALARAFNPVRFGTDAFRVRSFYRAVPFLTRRRYDVGHCHFGPNGILGAELRSIGALKAPLLTQFHGYDASSYLRQHGRDVYKTLFRDGELFLTDSERIRQRLVELGCAASKTAVHHTGVKTEDFAFNQRTVAPDGVTRILTVGRLVGKKGIEFGIRAVARLVRQFPNVHYTIVGGGPDRAALTALCRTLQIECYVEFAGEAARDVVVTTMRNASILLAPSVVATDGDEEGIPVVLMEALASGLPVVSTRHAGIPELISHGRSGLLAEERDSEALAEHLAFLITHPAEYQAMAVEGRRTVEAEYDVGKLNTKLMSIYQRLLSNAAAG